MQRRARGREERGCEGEDKEDQLEGRGKKRADETGLCKVHGAGPRFGLTRVYVRPRRLFSLPFSTLLSSCSFFLPASLPLDFLLAHHFTLLLMPSLRSLSLARPLNAILETSQRFSSKTRRQDLLDDFLDVKFCSCQFQIGSPTTFDGTRDRNL